MPNPSPFPKRRPQFGHGDKPLVVKRGSVRYAELHCKTNFSFLEGASHPDELAQRAAELGYQALAITDRNSVAGVVRAHVAAKEAGLKLLIGAEVTPDDGPPVILLATDRAAYGRLARLLTRGRRRAAKGECHLTFDDVAEHAEGLLALVSLHTSPTRERGKNDRAARPSLARRATAASLHLYRHVFGDRCYGLAELFLGPNDQLRLQQMIEVARQARVPLAAANDVHYHKPERRYLQDVLSAIRHGCTVAELGHRMFPNAERHLKSPQQMAKLFAEYPAAVRRTIEVAERCTFSLDELRYEYPRELAPDGETPIQHLRRLAWKGAEKRYTKKYGEIPEKICRQLDHELEIIDDLHYEAFFLTVYDLVKFARSRKPPILCQGRGSAANSSVCFCLGITEVDPMETDLLFERFVSRERHEAPDIDVDFEHERREEVLQYVYQKYGRERAGIAAEVITYRSRSAIRDVGKVLGLSLDRVNVLAKNIDVRSEHTVLSERCRQSGIDPDSRIGRQLIFLANELLGFPRHLGQHVGGMVITQGPLCELVPIENAAMDDRTVIEWDKDDLDELGILKVDCLSLGILTAIHKCFDLIEKHYGPKKGGPKKGTGTFCAKHPAGRSGKRDLTPLSGPLSGPLTIANIPQDDRDVYEMTSRADTIGVFQIESRAQMSMLPRLRPERFYDLVIEVAIVRPGPIQGKMVHPYLRRRDKKRNGEELEPICSDEAVNKVLERTLGVPLFQEQAMQLAIVAAGFSPGEADRLRKAMGGWRRPGLIDSFRDKLFAGMLAKGHSKEFAERLFNQIRGFGEYGFPESHAASFAKLAYVSAWLKYYYPAAFTASLINSQPMGFYAPSQLVTDARNHDVEVRPIDVNFSNWDCTLEEKSRVEGRGSSEHGCGRRSASRTGGDLRSNPPAGSADPRPAEIRNLQSFALRLGFRLISGLSQSHADAIVRARHDLAFTSFEDFRGRTKLRSVVLRRLSKADAFRSLDVNRRLALWHSLPEQETLPLLDHVSSGEPPVQLPAMSANDEVVADYRSTGLSLKGHPFEFIRPMLEKQRVVPASQLPVLPADRRYKVAGLVLMRQRPSTAKSVTFVTLEDETGTVNLIVRNEVWKKHRHVAHTATVMLAHGRLQREKETIHILADKLEDLTAHLAEVKSRSRDFR